MRLTRRQVAMGAVAALIAPLASGGSRAPARRRLAITGANVLPMVPGAVPIENALVVIANGRIEHIGPLQATRPPSDAQVVAGQGKWLMPALTDMHVHTLVDRVSGPLEDDYLVHATLTPYLANGVLQIFNLSATAASISLAASVDGGSVRGPRVANAVMIDGSPPVWPQTATIAATPDQGRRIVRELADAGHRFVKVYSRLELDVYAAIIDEARQRGLRVVGHIPNAVKGQPERAFVPGLGLIAHGEELAKQSPTLSDDDIVRFAKLAKANGTWLCPTLTSSEWIARQTRSLDALKALQTLRYLPKRVTDTWLGSNRYASSATPERIERFDRFVEFNRGLVRGFAAEGVPLVSGTDSLIPGVVPGFALLDELQALAAAGLSNDQVLAAATRLPAQWLGVDADRGTIELGKRANLLLLDANPQQDIAAARKAAGVVVDGEWLARAELDQTMHWLAERNRLE